MKFEPFIPTLLKGPSGCGKTRTLIDLARRHFAIVVTCGEEDNFYKSLLKEVRPLFDSHKPNADFYARAEDAGVQLVICFLIARGLLLLQLCRNAGGERPQIPVTPLDFLNSQLMEPTGFYERVFMSLVAERRRARAIWEHLCTELSCICPGFSRFLICIDESQIAWQHLSNDIVSRWTLETLAAWDITSHQIRNKKGAAHPHVRRGLLSYIITAVDEMKCHLIMASTQLLPSPKDDFFHQPPSGLTDSCRCHLPAKDHRTDESLSDSGLQED